MRIEAEVKLRGDRHVEIEAEIAETADEHDLVERNVAQVEVETAVAAGSPIRLRGDLPASVGTVGGDLQIDPVAGLFIGQFESGEGRRFVERPIIEDELAARNADPFERAEGAVRARHHIEQARQSIGHLPHRGARRAVLRRAGALGSRPDNGLRGADRPGEDDRIAARRNRHRSLGQHREPHVDVEDVEPLRHDAAEQQGQRIERHFGLRRHDDRPASRVAQREAGDAERQPPRAGFDRCRSERERIAGADLLVERSRNARAEIGNGERSLGQACGEETRRRQGDDEEGRENRQADDGAAPHRAATAAL